jgi:hypothetical protein
MAKVTESFLQRREEWYRVAQTFLSAGSRDIPVPCFQSARTGDWKVARTRRLESLRHFYGFALISARMSDDTPKFRIGSVQYLNAMPLTHGIENELIR